MSTRSIQMQSCGYPLHSQDLQPQPYSGQCQWRKWKSNSRLTNQAVSELLPPPKRHNCALDRKPMQADRLALYEDLKKYGRSTGLSWLLSPEPPVVNKLPMPSIEEIIFSEEFLLARGIQEQLDCLVRRSNLDEQKIFRVSEITVGQRDNPAWHIARRGRLTASNFGSVLRRKGSLLLYWNVC